MCKDIIYPLNMIKLNNSFVKCPMQVYKYLLNTNYKIHKLS